VIVGPVAVHRRGGEVERRASIRWDGGECELRSVAPEAMADATDDATAFLAVALPLAMRRGEDLEVHGPVSPRFLGALEALQECYAQWHPGMRVAAVTASPGAARAGTGGGRGVFLSRGVDSLFAAARDGDRLTAAVHASGLEPLHDTRVRDREAELAARAAEDLGLESVTVLTNVRELSDPVFPNWEDFVAPGLAFCAHTLAGGLRSMLVASADSYATVEPCGTSPLLDPLYSSDAMTIEHAPITHSRLRKVAWFAAERPDLLAHLKVCYSENRTDNCGRCGKCTITMGALVAAGALDRATQFEAAPDPASLKELRMRSLNARLEWTELADALGAGDPLAVAIRQRLEETRLRDPSQLPEPHSLRAHRAHAVVRGLFGSNGSHSAEADTPLGLVRAVDDDRHRYGVGAIPPGVLAGELGALHSRPEAGSIPVWLTPDELLVTAGGPPSPGRARRLRWVLAPLRWGGGPAGVAWRLTRAHRSPAPDVAATGAPAGYLRPEPGEGRRPLYSARHGITGDQLLTSHAQDAGDSGYGDAALMGYLDAVAPETGELGITARPRLPWASRFGRLLRLG
jgi:hypothetical protein